MSILCTGCHEYVGESMFVSNGRGGKRRRCTPCMSKERLKWSQTTRNVHPSSSSYLLTGLYGVDAEFKRWAQRVAA